MTDSRLDAYLRRRRDALINELGKIEELLGMPRSIVPRRKRVPLGDNETVTHVRPDIDAYATEDDLVAAYGTDWRRFTDRAEES